MKYYKLNPYSFPGLDVSVLDEREYPFAKNYKEYLHHDKIFNTIQREFELTREEIRSTSRKQERVFARTILTFIFRRVLGLSYARVGMLIGKKDHATAMHNEKVFCNLYNTSRDYKERVDRIFDRLDLKVVSYLK